MKRPKPPRSILDPAFKYTTAAKTDIAKTFRRIRREQQEAAKIAAASNVKPMIAKTRKVAT